MHMCLLYAAARNVLIIPYYWYVIITFTCAIYFDGLLLAHKDEVSLHESLV